MTTIAELCAGYGGLAMALHLLDQEARLAWVAETDPDASTVLAAHHPETPNHGDITAINWANVEQVDILAGGWPCQPFSAAGARRGTDDARHLWPVGVLPAVSTLRPSVFVGENVPGLLTISSGAVFRTILGDLMGLGYTVRWATLGSCKLGLCHHRHRLFVLVTRAVGELPCELGMPLAAWSSWPRDGVASGGDVWEYESDPCGTAGMTLPTPTARNAERGGGWGDRPGRPLSEVIAMLPTPTASDGAGGAGRTSTGGENLRTAVTLLPTPLASRDERGLPGVEVAQERMASGRRMLDDAVALLPTPTATPYGNNQSPSAGAQVRPSLEGVAQLLPTPRATDGAKGGPNQRGSSGDLALPAAVQPERWGRYAAAITRHELVVGRPAPEPTITGKRGGRRLNPQLTEWMQGLPAGWITGPLAGNPNAANKAAGNGVIPVVAAEAVRLMCERAGWAGLPLEQGVTA